MEKFGMPEKSKLAMILLAAAGILLLLLGSMRRDEPEADVNEVQFYTEYLEERLTRLCTSVDGIDQAAVFLTLDCSSEYIYNQNGASDFLILKENDGEEAVLLQEIYPRVRGVAVVCTGGNLPRIRETVTELLSAALDLPSHRIKVAGSQE